MKRFICLFCFGIVSSLVYAIEEPEIPTLSESPVEFSQDVSFKSEELNLQPSALKPYKSTFLTMTFASTFPGLGHVYLGEFATAGELAISTGVSYGLATWKDSSVNELALATLQNTWAYGIYAAYRDVRNYKRNEGYKYAMPNESFIELAKAPFDAKILKKPEVWGGLLGALSAATMITYAQNKYMHRSTPCDVQSNLFPIVAFPVGLGEEAFFRGYLQPMLSEPLTPLGGIIS